MIERSLTGLLLCTLQRMRVLQRQRACSFVLFCEREDGSSLLKIPSSWLW